MSSFEHWTVDEVEAFLRTIFPGAVLYIREHSMDVDDEDATPLYDDTQGVVEQIREDETWWSLPTDPPLLVADLQVVYGTDTRGRHALVPADYDTRYGTPDDWDDAQWGDYELASFAFDIFGDPPIDFVPPRDRIDIDWAIQELESRFPDASFYEVGQLRELWCHLGVVDSKEGLRSARNTAWVPPIEPEYIDPAGRENRSRIIEERLDAFAESVKETPWDEALERLAEELSPGRTGAEPLRAESLLDRTKTRPSLGELFNVGADMLATARQLLDLERDELRAVLDEMAQVGDAQLKELPMVVVWLGAHRTVSQLIKDGESATVEFKETANYNVKTKTMDKAMTSAVSKTIAAFMNADGGTLLIGVTDRGEIKGLARDLKRHGGSIDRFENWLTTQILRHLGEASSEHFRGMRECDVWRIDVTPASRPVWAELPDKQEAVLIVRSGNSSRTLTAKDASEYIEQHFSRTRPA